MSSGPIIPMGILIMLIVLSIFFGAIGFIIGYFVGQRNATRRLQSGFPVQPIVGGESLKNS